MNSAIENVDSPPRISAEEFFALGDDGCPGKKELIEGEVVAMSPASGTHALIQGNIAVLIGSQLRAQNSPCRVGTEAPLIPRFDTQHNNVRVPDIAVTCLPPSDSKSFPDPVLIVEVLSPSNERETRDAIYACATIPALREIMVVKSEAMRVEVFRRDAQGDWPQAPQVDTSEGAIQLESIDVEMTVGDIYAGTILTQ